MNCLKIVSVCLLFIFVSSFLGSKDGLFNIPQNWPKPIYNFSKNPLTKEKIELGRALFYDPILSQNNTISCSGCHSQFTAFTHVDHALSHGINDRIGTRNAPVLINLAWNKRFMWDGAINHLDVQALAPISHSDEMGSNISEVVTKLQHSKIYPPLFFKAFGDSLITGENTLKCISQFMLTLVSANSKYDSVKRNESSFTKQEENGYKIFNKNCTSCHIEPLFTNQKFENNGLPLDLELKDFGRMKVTQNPNDSLKFKVPTLRNIEFSYPYMHDGRFKNLNSVLDHYGRGIVKSKTLALQLEQPIVLSANEKVDLISFLLTLSDKKFLFNPEFGYPKNLLLSLPKD